MEIFEKNGKFISYEIHKKRIKNTYFRVKDGYLKVTTNPRTKKQLILSYLDLKFDQIHEKIEQIKRSESDYEIAIWDKTYLLSHSYGRFKYEFKDNSIFVQSTKSNVSDIKKQIYLSELKKEVERLQEKVNAIILKRGIKPLPFKFKYLKSKFGSYHRKNKEITLNTFLSRLNPIYLEYVIYHEYAHVLVFNHSKDFYNLLSEFMPNHRVYQKDLKRIAII